MVDIPLERPQHRTMLRPFVAPVLRHAGWFGVFLILAPVIGPRGYGVFVLALSGIAISEAVLAEPLGAALAGLDTVEPRHWSTALMTAMIGGGALWLAARAGAPLLNAWVGEPGFWDMFQSLAIVPLLGGLAAVPAASLRRNRQAGALTGASVAGLVAGGGVALSLAWAGAGAWSLVAQIIMQRLVECLVLWASPSERIGLHWSARHFAELAEALDAQSLAPLWRAVSHYAPCFLVGLVLGPTAAGLYWLASQLAAGLAEIALAHDPDTTPRQLLERMERVLLPCVLASGLLATALPPLLDLRWWAAVPPAQILLLGAIPAAIGAVCSACFPKIANFRWHAVETLGGIAVVACAVRFGLTAAALTTIGWGTAVAFVGLWRIRGKFGPVWRLPSVAALRPWAGAALAGLVLCLLAEPVSLRLAPVPALCLLTACGWLAYLVVRGDPASPRYEPAVTIDKRSQSL